MSLGISAQRLWLGVALGGAVAGCAGSEPSRKDSAVDGLGAPGGSADAPAATSEIPRGEKPASCDPNRSCVTSACAQYQGVDRARCSGGRCVLGFECDPTNKVLCKRLPPVCPPGEVPRVVNGCFGGCVDARQCLTVASCAVCAPADPCVRAVAALAGWHCHAPLSASREM